MAHPFIYVGCFVKSDEVFEKVRIIKGQRLEKMIEHPHVTFEYKPELVDENFFGEIIDITIIGYACDGKNEGVLVNMYSKNSELQEIIDRICVPHITLSVSKNGKPVDTKNLDFKPCEPIKMSGKYGGYDKWGKVIIRKKKD